MPSRTDRRCRRVGGAVRHIPDVGAIRRISRRACRWRSYRDIAPSRSRGGPWSRRTSRGRGVRGWRRDALRRRGCDISAIRFRGGGTRTRTRTRASLYRFELRGVESSLRGGSRGRGGEEEEEDEEDRRRRRRREIVCLRPSACNLCAWIRSPRAARVSGYLEGT